MSIHIKENAAGTIKAFGCHVDLWQEDVQIEAEYTAGEKRCGDNLYPVPSSCEITAMYVRFRRLDEPEMVKRRWIGANVVTDWEAAIIDEIEGE